MSEDEFEFLLAAAHAESDATAPASSGYLEAYSSTALGPP